MADTSGVFASLYARDPEHQRVAQWWRQNFERIVMPSACIGELAHLLGSRAQWRVEVEVLMRMADGGLPIVDAEGADFARAADLVEQYADFPLGTVDALIIAIAERLEVTTVLTLDRRHFGAVRPRHVSAFTLVP